MRDYESVLDACGKCSDCPAVMSALQMSAIIESSVDSQLDEVMDPKFDEDAAQHFEGFIDFASTILGVPADELPSSPDDLAVKARQGAAKLADIADSTVDELLKTAEEVFEGCEGPLTLRAVSKGVEYRTKVCRSPRIPQTDEYTVESIPVRRRKTSD